MSMKKFLGTLSAAAGLILVMLLGPKMANAAGGVQINAANFPDEAFRHYIAENFDTDQNGELSEDEIAAVTEMTLTNISENGQHVPLNSLKGIEKFTNLEKLDCSGNLLKSLDLSANTSLYNLYCSNNQLTSLTVNADSMFSSFICSGNQLTKLDLPKEVYYTLDCSDNQLETLTFSGEYPSRLFCQHNQLTKLDLRDDGAGRAVIRGEKTTEGVVAKYYLEDEYIFELSVDSGVKLNVVLTSPTFMGVYGEKPSEPTMYWWNNTIDVENYVIYRRLEGDETSKKIGSTVEHSYKDKLPRAGNYIYEIRSKYGKYYSNPVSSSVYTYNPFTDVSSDASYFNSVMWAAGHGVVSGTTATTFSPDSPCTRYQFAVMIYRLAGKPAVSGVTLPFSDVPEKASYYNAVAWAYSNGIISGTSKDKFSPNKTVTRYQVVQMLYKMAGKPKVTAENPFTDVSSDASYYNAVMWAVGKKITKGTSASTFSPYAPCKRSQMVVFLKKFNLIYKFK